MSLSSFQSEDLKKNKEYMKNVNQKEFIDIAQNNESMIIDVRRPSECAAGIVPNAIMINLMDQRRFSDELGKLDKQKHYLVYCRTGARSGRACNMMKSLGFGNTYNLQGGILGWSGPIE